MGNSKKPLKIWVDGYEANAPQRLGSSQIGFELLKQLERLDTKNEYTVLVPEVPSSELPKPRLGWQYKVLKPKRLWTRIALPVALFTARNRPDVFLSVTHYAPRFSPVKRVVTIFDLANRRFPQFFKKDDLYKMNNWTKTSLLSAAHVVTISNASKKDIMRFYGIDSKKITVVYPGFEAEGSVKPSKEEIEKAKEKYKIDSPYIIYVGTLQPRKNVTRLIEAFAKTENLKLVIVGKTTGAGRQGWMFEDILKKPAELGIENRVIFTGFVPQEEMFALLTGAVAYILPSLWEGFGIPPLNAMSFGTPAIVSNVSSLPEVVGEAGLLVDPESVTQIEQAIRAISSDMKLREKKSKEGLQQVKKFSWEKMAKGFLKVLEEVGKE